MRPQQPAAQSPVAQTAIENCVTGILPLELLAEPGSDYRCDKITPIAQVFVLDKLFKAENLGSHYQVFIRNDPTGIIDSRVQKLPSKWQLLPEDWHRVATETSAEHSTITGAGFPVTAPLVLQLAGRGGLGNDGL